MIGPQRQSQSPNSKGEAPFGNVGNSNFPPPPPPPDSHDVGIGATPIVPCPCTPPWGPPSWWRPWRSRIVAAPCRACSGCSSPCKARSRWGRSGSQARSCWGRSPCQARSRRGRSPCQARSRRGSSACKARSRWGRSACNARSRWCRSPCNCGARPSPGRSPNSCCARSWTDTSPRPPCQARSCWDTSPLPPDRARSPQSGRLAAAACDTSGTWHSVFSATLPFQYPDCRIASGTETRFKAVLRDWTSLSNHVCFASLGVITSPVFWPLWGFHNLSPFLTCGFDSHVSYKLLTKLVPSTSGSPAVGNGGIGGNIGSSTGGGPFGTLVPFGVNRFESPFSQASGLTARSRVLCLGVLLPPLPWRSVGKVPLPLEPSTEVPFTADHGDKASPEPAFTCTCCNCPLRHSSSCMSLEFRHLKNSTSSPSRARWRPSLLSSALFPADLTLPCDNTGPSHPGIRPSVLISPDPCSVGNGVPEPSRATPPRPFPVDSADDWWNWTDPPAMAWSGLSFQLPSTGSAEGLDACNLHSSWTFCDQKGLLSIRSSTGTDFDLSMFLKRA